MEIRIIKGTNQIGGCITEITSKNAKILIDFGNDLEDTKESFELDGLTYGKSKYNAVFITHSHNSFTYRPYRAYRKNKRRYSCIC